MNDILSFFATHKHLAEILIDHRVLKKPVKHGSEYMNTVLGALLNISILPTNPLEPCQFFTDVADNVSFTFIQKSFKLHLSRLRQLKLVQNKWCGQE